MDGQIWENELSVFVDDEVGLKAVKLESQEKEEVEDPIQFDCWSQVEEID